MSSKEKDNILRWDGKRRGCFELYFLKWNDEKSRSAGWIRYTMNSPYPTIGPPYCELWGIFFDGDNPSNNFAVKKRYPIDSFSWDSNRFGVRIDDASLSMNACNGAICDEERGHSLQWDLAFHSSSPTYYYFPKQLLYKTPFPKTKAICPHPDARFSGKLVANGREIILDNAPGQQEHGWGGAKRGVRWAWGQCNTFKEDPTAIWEGVDVLLPIGLGLNARFKLFYLRADGQDYMFNALHRWVLNKSSWELGEWDFEARQNGFRLVGKVTSRFEDFIGITYDEADGGQLWCNNSKVSAIHLKLFGSGGSLLKELTCDQSCAAEYVDRKIHPRVPIHI